MFVDLLMFKLPSSVCTDYIRQEERLTPNEGLKKQNRNESFKLNKFVITCGCVRCEVTVLRDLLTQCI